MADAGAEHGWGRRHTVVRTNNSSAPRRSGRIGARKESPHNDQTCPTRAISTTAFSGTPRRETEPDVRQKVALPNGVAPSSRPTCPPDPSTPAVHDEQHRGSGGRNSRFRRPPAGRDAAAAALHPPAESLGARALLGGPELLRVLRLELHRGQGRGVGGPREVQRPGRGAPGPLNPQLGKTGMILDTGGTTEVDLLPTGDGTIHTMARKSTLPFTTLKDGKQQIHCSPSQGTTCKKSLP